MGGSQFLLEGEKVPVDDAEESEGEQEEQKFAVDEFVEASAPLAQQPRESAAGRRGHFVLVADRHGSRLVAPPPAPPRTWRPLGHCAGHSRTLFRFKTLSSDRRRRTDPSDADYFGRPALAQRRAAPRDPLPPYPSRH